jgi:hypothetical protein
MQGIITYKDVFRAILNNRISLDNLVSNAAITEGHRVVFDQYREFFFNNILQKRLNYDKQQ